ncbi:hypothetical protein BC831DRAFT_444514 [Entophlyctis helioformis]|nr:hypothetical protein BC831DRAFT_444514 [Entophlyctis helioformis]
MNEDEHGADGRLDAGNGLLTADGVAEALAASRQLAARLRPLVADLTDESSISSNEWLKSWHNNAESAAGGAGLENVHNPSLVESFIRDFGITPWRSTVMDRTRSGSVNYLTLRLEQNKEWALNLVDEGTAHAQLGKDDDAIRKYNAALDIDPDCIEALVARGAALANQHKLVPAIKDFESALRLDPGCANAIAYRKRTREALERENADKAAVLRGEFVMPVDYDAPRNKAAGQRASHSAPSASRHHAQDTQSQKPYRPSVGGYELVFDEEEEMGDTVALPPSHAGSRRKRDRHARDSSKSRRSSSSAKKSKKSSKSKSSSKKSKSRDDRRRHSSSRSKQKKESRSRRRSDVRSSDSGSSSDSSSGSSRSSRSSRSSESDRSRSRRSSRPDRRSHSHRSESRRDKRSTTPDDAPGPCG